jgi:hypothetical protein
VRQEDLARLRPSMPVSALSTIMGDLWQSPGPKDKGYVFSISTSHGFSARIDVSGNLGSVSFHKPFSNQCTIEGLHLTMPLQVAQGIHPALKFIAKDEYNISEYKMELPNGTSLTARFREGALLGLDIFNNAAEYPDAQLPQANPELKKCFDIFLVEPQVLTAKNREAVWGNGWCFGLPPGILTTQWPLSKKFGFPLRHAFTMKLPEEYRTKGSQFVALSFFVDDQFETCKEVPDLKAFMESPSPVAPSDDDTWQVFSKYKEQKHPMAYSMKDTLDTEYVGIWLTEKEFTGRLCKPPDLKSNRLLDQKPEPGWLYKPLKEYFGHNVHLFDRHGKALHWLSSTELHGAFPLEILEREDDPNVGKPPREWEQENAESGYIAIYTAEAEGLNLERFHGRNHLGGTMLPIQGYPEFGPFYFEFEEYFGGFNFGFGVGQIDLELMQMDWGCG